MNLLIVSPRSRLAAGVGRLKSAMRLSMRFAYANALPNDLFTDKIKLPRVRQLFAKYVRLVEIENHSYCNRTCSFCPNSSLDRISRVVPIEGAVYDRIINDLASINYNQTLVWARYHEPLADDSIYERLMQARKALPKAFLSVTSNGDYLNADTLKRLENVGVNHMYISLYLPDGEERIPEVIAAAKEKFQRRTGLTYGKQTNEYMWRMDGSKMQMLVSVPNYSAAGQALSSRGGLIQVDTTFKDYQRTSVCFSPLHHVVVDYNGKSMLCCQTRSDAPEHQNSVIGYIGRDEYSLFHHYRDLAGARAGLFRGGPKHGVCKTCSQNAEGPYRVGRVDALAGFIGLVPGARTAFDAVVNRNHRHRRYELTDG
jgi:hypothetical protein